MQTHVGKAKIALSISLVCVALSVVVAIADPFNLGEPWVVGLVLSIMAVFAAFSALACAVEMEEDYLQNTAACVLAFLLIGGILTGYILSGSGISGAVTALIWGCFGTLAAVFAITCMAIYVVDGEQIEQRERATKEKAKRPGMV